MLVILLSACSSDTQVGVCYSCFWNQQSKEVVNLINSTLFKYEAVSNYTESDRLLILGRINNNEELVCQSIPYKLKTLKNKKDKESWLLLYEELYFLAKECDSKYSEIYLVRNARLFKLYRFSDGNPMEPDFVLFLKENRNEKRNNAFSLFRLDNDIREV